MKRVPAHERAKPGRRSMKKATTMIVAIALGASLGTAASAHKHKGWGCHKHPSLYGGTIHCGNGSR